jgi:hypothetical protein
MMGPRASSSRSRTRVKTRACWTWRPKQRSTPSGRTPTCPWRHRSRSSPQAPTTPSTGHTWRETTLPRISFGASATCPAALPWTRRTSTGARCGSTGSPLRGSDARSEASSTRPADGSSCGTCSTQDSSAVSSPSLTTPRCARCRRHRSIGSMRSWLPPGRRSALRSCTATSRWTTRWWMSGDASAASWISET